MLETYGNKNILEKQNATVGVRMRKGNLFLRLFPKATIVFLSSVLRLSTINSRVPEVVKYSFADAIFYFLSSP